MTDPVTETETQTDEPFTLAFLGYAPDAGRAGRPCLRGRGATPAGRPRRPGRVPRHAGPQGEDEALPLEVHLLWFPGRAALGAYLADDRRAALRAEYGDVFSRTELVAVEERG